MGFFDFLKKKNTGGIPPSKNKGPNPLKLDVNMPPTEPIKSSPSAPNTPEVPSSSGLPPQQEYHAPPAFGGADSPSSFKEAEKYKGEMDTKEISKNIELLSAKLDAIKLMIENLNNRLDRIEGEKKKETLRW